ncbi:MAG: type I restriction enzyme HsdR N-terminal domain-containing protein [Candidatus Shikimatogenerans bostrichidophilus]|nr:MAG: type I restriction enzyme HsdR N-terminal domain-containing protein [Candidatus Shikimatogenerans bostrichidophilus]
MNNFLYTFIPKNLNFHKFYKKKMIYCIKRKKFYLCTLEEYLRQKILLYLIIKKGYNLYNIFVEEYFIFNYKNYKIDILIKKNNKPFFLIECKSPINKINYYNIHQILHYGSILNCKYFFLTNQTNNFIFLKKNNKIKFLKTIPYNK